MRIQFVEGAQNRPPAYFPLPGNEVGLRAHIAPLYFVTAQVKKNRSFLRAILVHKIQRPGNEVANEVANKVHKKIDLS